MTEQQAATPAPATDAPPPDTTAEKHKLCLMLYVIFAVSLVLQFINIWTIVISTAAVFAGLIIAYSERKKAYGTVYGNHLQWIIRTFWIGGSVYLPIVTLVGAGAMLFFMDYAPMAESFSTGEGSMQKAAEALITQNSKVIYITMTAATAPFAIWWWYRCWYGYKRLKAGKPIPDPTSWF